MSRSCFASFPVCVYKFSSHYLNNIIFIDNSLVPLATESPYVCVCVCVCVYTHTHIYTHTHRVFQEKRSILSEVTASVILSTELYMYMWPIANGFTDRAISVHSCTAVDKQQILRIVSNIGIYCTSVKAGTVHLVLYVFENSTVNIKALCNSYKDRARCSSWCILALRYERESRRTWESVCRFGETRLESRPKRVPQSGTTCRVCLTHDNGTTRLSRNVANYQSTLHTVPK